MKFLKFWFPVFVYSGIIFYISSLPDLSLPYGEYFSDKPVHSGEYIVLGFLWYRAMGGTTALSRRSVFITTLIFCTLYGLIDEIHQSFVPGRDCALGDLIADIIGGTLGAIAYPLVIFLFKRKKT